MFIIVMISAKAAESVRSRDALTAMIILISKQISVFLKFKNILLIGWLAGSHSAVKQNSQINGCHYCGLTKSILAA
jgi:hypothetical protein